MSDLQAWTYLAATIVCGVTSVLAICYATKARRFLPGIPAAALAGVSIACSLPFRRTHELPWLPGVVILFFAAAVFAAVAYVLRRPSTVGSENSRNRAQFGLGTLAVAVLFLCIAFAWIAVVNKEERERWAALKGLPTHDLINIDDEGFYVLRVRDTNLTNDDVPRLIAGLVVYPMKVREIDVSTTRVTEEGAQTLKRALPGCKIRH